MNPRAVIYCSKHGSTKQIAKMIADKYNLPLINIMHINGYSFQEVPVIFCGWIKKGKIQGLVKAENLFSCIEIVAVGSMPSNESSRLKLKYENNIDKQIFTYVQSKPYIEPTLKEKIWISLFESSLQKRIIRKEIKIEHEYTI